MEPSVVDPQHPSSDLLNSLLLKYAEDLRVLMERQRTLESRTENLDRMAHYDLLTGLPNRQLFMERLTGMMKPSRRPEDAFTLMFIDLDGFKQINDNEGHHIGDCVLQTVARRLTASIRESDTVARLGGDEFVVIARALSGDENIAAFCAKAIGALSEPITDTGKSLLVGSSFGCAEYPRHGEDEVTLLAHADAAMYCAKAAGGNTFCVYSRAM